MLLESPRLRFTATQLEVKKAHAKRRVELHFESKTMARDEGYSRRNLIERRCNRKVAGARVSALLRQKGEELGQFGKIAQALGGYYGGGMDSIARFSIIKHGFDIAQAVRNNHKTSWIVPVWYSESWFQNSPYQFYHDVHQSEEDPTQIAYNRTIDGIRRNIQTRTRPGKYLSQFFGDVLSEQDIKYWAERQVAAATCVAELKFIENDNPDGWIDIYERGPSSCMRGKDAVKVYALEGNGLRLAYLQTGEEVVARTIVVDGTNDAKVTGWVRIYAREQRWDTAMRQMVEAAGYAERTNMDGVKIQLIENYNGYVCPYIDYGEGGDQTVSVDHQNNCLVIGGGDFDATSTDGYVNQGETCDCCGESGYSDDDMTYIECEEQSVCPSCRDNDYTYAYGRRYEEWFPNDDVIYCETDGNYYHQEYYGNHDIVYVETRNEYYHQDDTVCVDLGDNEGEYVHVDDYNRDDVSGEIAHQDEFKTINGKTIHESYVVSCHVSGRDVDVRECVEIKLHTKHRYWYTGGYTEPVTMHIHQDSLTAEVILSDFVQCGDLLLPNSYYGNPVTCCTHSNLTYGDEYTGDRIEDVLVADAEECLAA